MICRTDTIFRQAGAIAAGVADIPAQLMFVHQGQSDVKEVRQYRSMMRMTCAANTRTGVQVHWHQQIPGCLMSTSVDGINVFKPANWS
jgi:ribosome assembly protein RRB1